MKITKRQLRRVIKEEKLRLLKEGSLQGAEEKFTEALSEYVMVLDEEMGYDIPNDQLKAEVMNLVDGHFEFLEDYKKNPSVYEGTTLKEMPSAWQQVLGTCRGYSDK